MHIYFTRAAGPLYSGRNQGQFRAKQEFVPGHIDGSLTVIHIHVERDVFITSPYFSGLLDHWPWNAIVLHCDDTLVAAECDRFIAQYNHVFKTDLPMCFIKPGDMPVETVDPIPGFDQLAIKDLEWW